MVMTILSLGNREYFFKTFNMSNYEINEFKATLLYEEGEYIFNDLSIKSGNANSEDMKLALLESLAMFNARKDIDTSLFPNDINSSVYWETVDVTVQYNFRPWIPIANMYNRSYSENQGNALKLIRFGRMTKDNEDDILGFTGLDSSFNHSPTAQLKELPMNPTAFDGVNIPLDLNWKNAVTEITSEILIDDQRYSLINLQTIESENVDENSYRFLNKLMLNNKKFILPESVEFFEYKGTLSLKYVIYNEDTPNKSIAIIMLYNRGDYTSILSFSSYLNFYNDNRGYFNKILF